jgi:hypothetical protein
VGVAEQKDSQRPWLVIVTVTVILIGALNVWRQRRQPAVV